MISMSRYGHYRELRKIAAESDIVNLTDEQLAVMSDDELLEVMSDHYVFVEHFDHDQDEYEEEVILIPRDEWHALNKRSCYR